MFPSVGLSDENRKKMFSPLAEEFVGMSIILEFIIEGLRLSDSAMPETVVSSLWDHLNK